MKAYLKLLRFSWVFITLTLSLALLLQSCTFVGLGIGAIADGPNRKTVSPPKYAEIKAGNEIILILTNGDTLQGKFIKASQIEEKEYANQFTSFRSSKEGDTASFPLPGQTIFVLTKNSQRTKAEFIGFDYQDKGKSFLCRTAHQNEIFGFDNTSLKLVFKGIEDSSDNFWETELIIKLLSDEKLPLLSQIYVDSGGKTQKIPLEDIERVQKYGKQNGKITGLVIGAAIDAAILIGISQSFSEPIL